MTLTGEIPENVTGYRQVDLLWTLADSRRARREGWDVVIHSERGLVIDTNPEGDQADCLMSASKAQYHCFTMADVSTLHARALTIHFHSLAQRGK